MEHKVRYRNTLTGVRQLSVHNFIFIRALMTQF